MDVLIFDGEQLQNSFALAFADRAGYNKTHIILGKLSDFFKVF